MPNSLEDAKNALDSIIKKSRVHFGTIPFLRYPRTNPIERPQCPRHHQTQYSARQRKLLGIHYTPDSVIDYIRHLS